MSALNLRKFKLPGTSSRRFLGSLLFCLLVAGTTQAVSVEAEGRAAGQGPTARSEALTDALREAVRMGAGVQLVEQTKTQNSEVQFDRIFAKSLGFIKSYTVLSNSQGDDGIYRVKIKADVHEGVPDANDKMTLQMLSRERNSPRLSVSIDEKIEGVNQSGLARDWFIKEATGVGLKISDDNKRGQAADKAAKRAALLGNQQEAEFRAGGSMSEVDYVIEGQVIGGLTGSRKIYGLDSQIFSIGIDIKVIDAATGNVLVTENLPAREIAVTATTSPVVAAREAIRKCLEADPEAPEIDAGWTVLRRLYAHWISEQDLGSVFKAEFTNMELADATLLKAGLATLDKIGAVWVRGVDPGGISIIDIESRLDGLNLALKVEELMKGKYKLQKSENRLIFFAKADDGSQIKTTKVDEPTDGIKGILKAALGLSAALIGAALIKKKFVTN